MSLATTIGHTVTGVVGHHGRVHLPRHRTAVPAAAIDPAVRRQELAQWRGAFTLAIGLNR